MLEKNLKNNSDKWDKTVKTRGWLRKKTFMNRESQDLGEEGVERREKAIKS